VNFGALKRVFDRMSDLVAPSRIWLLLDEWSSVPLELQPYLADLLRRAVFPIRNVTVKIAAIEARSRFSIPSPAGDAIGLDIGSDAAADINLDDFLVFENDPERATDFYRSLLFQHVQHTQTYPELPEPPRSEQGFVQQAFTQSPVFDELVRAAEGVPRDAINIIIQSAMKAGKSQIAMNHVRGAAMAWYQLDKEKAVRDHSYAMDLLHWIIQQVIGNRKARAFLLRSDVRDELIDSLFEARVLHILKRNVSSREEPGARYNVYKLDYGCYVELINTVNNPGGLLPIDTNQGGGFVKVPPDDYRAIRGAILKLNPFYETVNPQA
jgi:hypothetical protein